MKGSRLSKGDQDRIGIGIIVLSIVVLLGVAAAGVIIRRSSDLPFDPNTLCSLSRDYPHTIVLIDKTDPFTRSQQQMLKSLILEVRGQMTLNEKLSLFVLDDKNYLAPIPVFAVCNPGAGKDANPLYQNPRIAEKIYQDKFGKPLDTALSGLLEVSSAPYSPIMEMVHGVSLLSDFSPSTIKRRLIVVSDLMHHTKGYSHLSGKIELKSFQSSEYAAKVACNLTGADVKLVYLVRPTLHAIQSQRRHQDFWAGWFQANNASQIEFRRAP